MALFTHLCVFPLCAFVWAADLNANGAEGTHTHEMSERERGWQLTHRASTSPSFPPSLFPFLFLSASPFVIKEGNTFSLGLFVYWFPPLFGELGTKTEFVLSWPPALSLNTPYFSFSSSPPLALSILSAWMSRLHMLPFWMSSLVNNGLIYCVSLELSRIFFSVAVSQWWFSLSLRES